MLIWFYYLFFEGWVKCLVGLVMCVGGLCCVW